MTQSLEQVLLSRTFEKTPTLRKLLSYLWEHRDEDLSEYAIAIDGLGRRSDFEPRIDATVRVQISRLRQRLREFYETEGSRVSSRLIIPLGTHHIQFQLIEGGPEDKAEPREPLSSVVRPAYPQAQPSGQSRPIVLVLCITIFLLALFSGWMLWSKQPSEHDEVRSQVTPLPVFWRQFLENGKRTRIIVPNPVFFTWSNGLMVRDRTVNDFSKLGSSTNLARLKEYFGKPELEQGYVTSSDAFASLRLDRFLDPQGTHILVSNTAESSADILDRENFVILGTPGTLTPFQGFLDQLGFQLDVREQQVVDRQPVPGAPAKFETVQESASRMITPGVVAVLPGGTSGTYILIVMATYHTSALVSYLTSEAGVKELENAQAAYGNSRFFEAVILSEIDGTTELRSWLAKFRPLGQKP